MVYLERCQHAGMAVRSAPGATYSVHQWISLNLTLNGFMLSMASFSATSCVTPSGYFAAISALYEYPMRVAPWSRGAQRTFPCVLLSMALHYCVSTRSTGGC